MGRGCVSALSQQEACRTVIVYALPKVDSRRGDVANNASAQEEKLTNSIGRRKGFVCAVLLLSEEDQSGWSVSQSVVKGRQ